MEAITEAYVAKRELLNLSDRLTNLRKNYADLKSIQAISSKPSEYEELLASITEAADDVKNEIREAINGQY
jgi:predicted  nucleic acid-binding Zn-ribbon protein